MPAESVVSATVEEAKRHPLWIVGGVIGVLAVLYFLGNRSAAAPAGQNFTFSYGPSDSQVAATTALTIAQTQASSANAIATTNAQQATTVANDYFSYLGHAADVSAGMTLANDTASTQQAQIAGNVSMQNTLVANTAATQQAQIAGTAATQQAQINANASVQEAGYAYSAANYATFEQGVPGAYGHATGSNKSQSGFSASLGAQGINFGGLF